MTDPKILVRRALLAEHERQVAEPPCPRCGRPRSNVALSGSPARTNRSGRVDAPLEARVDVCRCSPQRQEER